MKIIKSVALISDFNFNVFAPQTINNRLENFLYFWFVFHDWTILFPSINNFYHFILFVIFAQFLALN